MAKGNREIKLKYVIAISTIIEMLFPTIKIAGLSPHQEIEVLSQQFLGYETT